MTTHKDPIKFDKECPQCHGLGEVYKNSDNILWFYCPECEYNKSWHELSILYPSNKQA